MKRIVPLYLRMEQGSIERLIDWLKWRVSEDGNIADLLADGESLIRDGGFDLYHTVSASPERRASLFRSAYNKLTKAQRQEVLDHALENA